MSSSIPFALDEIVSALTAALTTAKVSDASSLADTREVQPTDNIWRRVVVGAEIGDGGEVVPADIEFDRDWASIGRLSMNEEYLVPCYLDCVSGDENMTALRVAAFALLDSLSAAIVAASLGHGIYEAAVFGRGSLTPVEDDEGASAGIRFTIRCKARIANT